MAVNDLFTRAMLVNLNLPTWSARKFDRKVTDDTNKAHGADADAGRYNKNLLPGDAKSYKALMSFVGAVRTGQHYAQTLPWSDDGWRLLPVKNYQKYTDCIRTATHEFNRLLGEFLRDYPTLRENARIALNGMYSDADYPSDVAGRFGITVKYAPVPTGGDFRVQLSQEEIDVIASGTEARVAQAFREAQADAVKRLYDCVARMHERLSQPDAIFRDSLIDNARDLCDVLTRINLTDDSNLESLRRQTELLAVSEPETLRRDPAVRAEVATRAQSILDAMTATYGQAVTL